MFSYRETPLLNKEARGRLIVTNQVIEESAKLLNGFCGQDGMHEGMLYWISRRVGDDCVALSVIRPNCKHGPRSVFSTDKDTGIAMTKARRFNLAIVAQVHSHPGYSSIHSDGDDELVLQAYDGMFSVVVNEYGANGISVETGASVHQFINGIWYLVSNDTPDVMVSVPINIG